MDKFWQWMEEKNYGKDIQSSKIVFNLGAYNTRYNPTYQTLVGYILEYIFENKKRYILNTDITIKENYLLLVSFINEM